MMSAQGIRFYARMVDTALKARAEYRADLAIGVLTSLLGQGAGLAFYSAVFTGRTTLDGWSAPSVLLLYSLSALILGTSELLFNGMWSLPWYIVSGQVDRLLLYPVNGLVFLLMSRPELHALGNLLTGAVLLAVSWAQLALPPSLLVCVPIWVACGVVIYTSALVLMGCLCFRVVGPWGHHFWFIYQLLGASRYPVSIYPRWLQLVLLGLFPIGVATYVPGRWLTGGHGAAWAVLAPIAVAVLMAKVSAVLWHRATRWYQSTGN